MTSTSLTERVISRPEFIALVAALMALNAIAVDVMLPALPYMGAALNVANENDRQFVLSAYLIGFGVAQLAYGPLSDRFGRRPPLLVGMAIYITAALAAIIAPNFATLLALRFVQGIGAAGTRVIAQSAVRDRFSGRAMAEVSSLVFMVFMAVPIVAPSVGQVLLLIGPWQTIFVFMGVLAGIIGLWAYLRLPETLKPENQRPLSVGAVIDGFRIVFTNRMALSYSIANTVTLAALFGFINTSQQIYVDVYGLGPLFPVAFAGMAGLMAVSSFMNSRLVGRFGMRRLAHGGMVVYVTSSGLLLVLSLFGPVPLPVFFCLLSLIMVMFGTASSNMNALSMEPLGAVAGTAASSFGFMQTVGGAVLGAFIGHQFNGTITPVVAGYFVAGVVAVTCALIAEKGKLFGVSPEYRQGAEAGH